MRRVLACPGPAHHAQNSLRERGRRPGNAALKPAVMRGRHSKRREAAHEDDGPVDAVRFAALIFDSTTLPSTGLW